MAIDRDDEAGEGCPYMNMNPCAKRKCRLYIKVRGYIGNTGETVDGWDCTHNWQTHLKIENTATTAQVGAAIESFRNEVVLGTTSSKPMFFTSPEEMAALNAEHKRLVEASAAGKSDQPMLEA